MEEMNKLLQIFKDAHQGFLDRDKSLLLADVNERTWCGALSQHLMLRISQSEYKGYYADIEYNRNNRRVKIIVNDKMEIVRINCDLIVHSRGENIEKDNLIAIEMKKSDAPEAEKQDDKIRLTALTKDSFDDIWSYDGKTFPEHVCRYSLGIYYEVNRRRRNILLEYFVKGKFVFKELITF